MQKYIQRSKTKFKTIIEAWENVAKNTNLTQRSVGPAHTRHYWKWKILRVNLQITKKSMQIKELTWEYVGEDNCLWVGKLDGMFGNIRFFISQANCDPAKYYLRNDINGVPDETCLGLDKAKKKAQDLLNSYAIGLTLG